MQDINKLEFHYNFADNTHTIDAYVRNRCEAELLNIAKEVIREFGYDIEVISEAPQKGSYVDVLNFVAAAPLVPIGIVTAITGIVALIYSRYPAMTKEAKQLIDLNIEGAKTDNAIKKLALEKAQNEKLDQIKLEDTDIKETVKLFDDNQKIGKAKSKLYKELKSYEKVTSISTIIYKGDEKIREEIVVERVQFNSYILTSDKLEDEVIEDAIVEIISPVLKNGSYKWRGIYNDKAIGFEMKDEG